MIFDEDPAEWQQIGEDAAMDYAIICVVLVLAIAVFLMFFLP